MPSVPAYVTAAISVTSLAVVGIGVAQWAIGIVVGARHARRLRKLEAGWAVRDATSVRSGSKHERSDRPTQSSDEARSFKVFVLVPCLNESKVIANTVKALESADERLTVVVIDDGSDDTTVEEALRASSFGRTTVVTRHAPNARQGKGRALNFGLQRVIAMVREQRLDPNQVVVAVMDADGQLSDSAIGIVLHHFEDERVGGLQLQVRIRNTGKVITDYQNYEFWGVSAPAQIARARFGSTSLGGNGQFARLSALLMMGGSPWSDALTEDLDLSISVMAHGWTCVSTPSAYVSQQAVTSLRKLVRQRTRWMQGHIQCARRIPELWRSDRLPNAACIEASSYLLSPLLLTLPWSILFHVAIVLEARFLLGDIPPIIASSETITRVAMCAAWYFITFIPAFVGGWRFYRRSDGEVSRRYSLLLSHLFVAFNYVSFLAVWRAVFRLALGRNAWAKTERVTETFELTDLTRVGTSANSNDLIEIEQIVSGQGGADAETSTAPTFAHVRNQ